MTVLKSYSTSVILFCRRYLGDHLKKNKWNFGLRYNGSVSCSCNTSDIASFYCFKKFNDTSWTRTGRKTLTLTKTLIPLFRREELMFLTKAILFLFLCFFFFISHVNISSVCYHNCAFHYYYYTELLHPTCIC